jgi:hypothetical protein
MIFVQHGDDDVRFGWKPPIPNSAFFYHNCRASNESIPDLCVSESSDEESDCDDGDDLVYECPGLAASVGEKPFYNIM